MTGHAMRGWILIELQRFRSFDTVLPMMPSEFDKGFTIQVRPTDHDTYQLRMVWYDDPDTAEETLLPNEYATLEEATVAATGITQDVIKGWGTIGDLSVEGFALSDSDDDYDDDELSEEVQQAIFDKSLSILRMLVQNMDSIAPVPPDGFVVDDEIVEEFSHLNTDFIRGMLFALPMCVAALPILSGDNIVEAVYLAALASIFTQILVSRGEL